MKHLKCARCGKATDTTTGMKTKYGIVCADCVNEIFERGKGRKVENGGGE